MKAAAETEGLDEVFTAATPTQVSEDAKAAGQSQPLAAGDTLPRESIARLMDDADVHRAT